MTYNPGQVEVIFPFLTEPPDWLVLGGPADADEAQVFHERYPDAKVIGVEPVVNLRLYQVAHDFPGRLIPAALSDRCGEAWLTLSDEHARQSSTARGIDGKVVFVTTVTLDHLSALYGPFTNAVLWLDIEGAELRALLGARGLFAAGAFVLVNVEVMPEEGAKEAAAIDEFLTGHGFTFAHEWDRQGVYTNRIYTRGAFHGVPK